MAEILIAVASKVAEYLVASISQGATYLFCFKQFIGDVEKAKDELEVKLADVVKRMEEADRKTEEIMPSVKKWLNDVNAILEEVQKLQQELEGGRHKCFNVSLKYSLAKQMESKAKQMMELQQNSNFEPFSQLIQLGTTTFSSKGFMDFNSRKLAYNNLLKAITDGKSKMVGLYGMGGSGKTTLAKMVGHEVTESKLFDYIIMAVVSNPPDVVKIQQEIAEKIGLELKEQLPSTRAERLSLGLKNKRFLLILDDIWRKISLEEIGIPLNEGCCILITTRLHDVCVSMDCESIIELHLLTEEEAWTLFKMHANLTDVLINEYDGIGRKIVDECKGLPIAIVTIGSTLKGKSIQAWKSTLRRLQHPPPLDIKDDLTTTYTIFEVSYDNLSSPVAKLLFLLCSMFPEDHEIHKEDLIRFCKGALKLEDTIVTMEDARIEILAALEILLNSCLLLHNNEQICVKMHDLVRDAALWIAKKKRQEILVGNHTDSNMLVRNHQSLKDTKALLLWNMHENFKHSNELYCPKLEILLFHPFGFNEDLGATETLKILAFITYGFQWHLGWRRNVLRIPRSIVSLTNLHTLCLRGKALRDISLLGELKGLEILDLRGSTFDELPAGIVNMKMLKLLDIFGCEVKESSVEVIGRCEQLEELYFWDKKSAIPKYFSLSSLRRYVIYDSSCDFSLYQQYPPLLKHLDTCDEALRSLCLQGYEVYSLNSSMMNLILRADILCLENCWWNYKDINFEIKHLIVSCCQEKRFIIDKLDASILQKQVFTNLITLRLIKMNSLEQVFQDSCISCPLPLLQELEIERCPKLRTCIFTHAMITSLPKLRKLGIHFCNKVKWLFSYTLASHCPVLENIMINSCSEFERLVDEEDAQGIPLLHDMQGYPYKPLILFPKLKDIAIGGSNKVRLLPYSLVSHCPSLEELYISDCSEIERLVDGESEKLFILKVLWLDNLPKLREVFRGGFEYKMESLHDKQEILQHKHENERVRVVNSELRFIILERLPESEYIWKGPPQIVSLHRLEYVSLENCPKLRNIFTLAIVTSFPKLSKLEIKQCDQWEGIFCDKSLKTLPSSIVCFLKLEEINISYCDKVRRIFSYSLASHCPSLKKIAIWNCSQLEGIVQAYEGEVATHHEKLFPKLNYLVLRRLPKLREIYPSYEFIRLSGTICIEECPNI